MSDRIEVRCCCTPTRVYGTLPAPDDLRPGVSVQYHSGSEVVELPVRTFGMRPQFTDELLDAAWNSDAAHQYIQDEIAFCRSQDKLALMMDDDGRTPDEKLAVLRGIQGFEEAD